MSFGKPIKKRRKIMGAAPSNNVSPSKGLPVALPIHSVPLEIVEEIFHNLPYQQVIRHCCLVCKQWKEVAHSESLWRERCRREGLMYYALCKKKRNLIKNPSAESMPARWDCACQYTIKVELLNKNKKCLQTFEPETVIFEQWNDQQWHSMTHVFKNYGPGVRYVRFIHGGQDRQFWAGWYGIRVTDSCVEICPDVE
ncbi:hypothetical protein WMY93_011569 [Mugilogobius chulae]|uniref:F-box only protein 6-like n=1 Tax=Mugilogobius chulae TaxID=88201 RepID=A0AAW0P2X8_9GOBI